VVYQFNSPGYFGSVGTPIFSQKKMILAVILITLVLALGYLVLMRKYSRLWKSAPTSNLQVLQDVKATLLVVFRNEEEHLPRLFQSIENLDTSGINLEIVLINDHSLDRSFELAKSFSQEVGAKALSLDKAQGKKAGVQKGWEASRGEFILQTDADCVLPKGWLQAMLSELKNAHFVSGPVTYLPYEGFFQKMVQLDFTGLIAIGAAHIQWKKPLMCNGANLGFRREAIEGVDLKAHRASGDDVFLMQSVAAKGSAIRFCKNQEAIVQTEPPKTIAALLNQRLRWASKNGTQQNRFNLGILIFVWFYNLCLLGALLSFNSLGFTIFGALLLTKVLVEDQLYAQIKSFFKLEGYWKTLLMGQLFHISYMAVIPVISQLISYTWKDRKQK
jgi:biofilm PGA synthesis N-glycosyltransferase PgaC